MGSVLPAPRHHYPFVILNHPHPDARRRVQPLLFKEIHQKRKEGVKVLLRIYNDLRLERKRSGARIKTRQFYALPLIPIILRLCIHRRQETKLCSPNRARIYKHLSNQALPYGRLHLKVLQIQPHQLSLAKFQLRAPRHNIKMNPMISSCSRRRGQYLRNSSLQKSKAVSDFMSNSLSISSRVGMFSTYLVHSRITIFDTQSSTQCRLSCCIF